jgi:hypothetical protein
MQIWKLVQTGANPLFPITNQLLYQLSYIGVFPGPVPDKRGKTMLPSGSIGK